jgi:hypothetical protein
MKTYPGWHLWTASNGSPMATRLGSGQPPVGDDGTWARTLIADSPDDLDRQLAEQAAHDAEGEHDEGDVPAR